jgi:hypothetical protein
MGENERIANRVAALLLTVALSLGLPAFLSAGEVTYRAVAYKTSPAFNLEIVQVIPVVGSHSWIVSGFAPDVGSFHQSVSATAFTINYLLGTAEVNTSVTTSTGATITVQAQWGTVYDTKSSTVASPNPTRVTNIGTKRVGVTGTIGSFTISGAYGELTYRTVVP